MVLLVCVVFVPMCVCVCVGKTPGCESERETLVDIFSQNSSPVFTFGAQPDPGRRPSTVFLPHQKVFCCAERSEGFHSRQRRVSSRQTFGAVLNMHEFVGGLGEETVV